MGSTPYDTPTLDLIYQNKPVKVELIDGTILNVKSCFFDTEAFDEEADDELYEEFPVLTARVEGIVSYISIREQDVKRVLLDKTPKTED